MQYAPVPLAAVILAVNAPVSAGPETWWQPLVQVGAVGAVLIWFMLRAEKRMEEQARSNRQLAKSIDQATQTHLLTLAGLKSLDRTIVRDLANQLEQDIKHKEEHTDAGIDR